MDNLDFMDQIALRLPLVWLTTDEPARAIERVAVESERPTFRLDAVRGLVQYDQEQSRWLRVLASPPGEAPFIIEELSDAFEYMEDIDDGIIVLIGNENMLNSLSAYFHSQIFSYRESFFSDSVESLPFQCIIMSHERQVPEAFRRIATHVVQELPDETDLHKVAAHMGKQIPVEEDKYLEIANAGLGLSETEFINAAIVSARNRGYIEPLDIVAKKKQLLKESNVIDVRSPKLTIDDLGGFDNAKKLVRQIATMWSNPEEMAHLGLTPIRRVMMVGVPGVGKSLICEAIASALGVDLGKGGVSQSLSKFVGESEENMRRTFSTLKKMAPIVFWIDEFGRDMSGGMSSGSVDGGTTDRVHGEFLTGLQELPDNIFLAAAANRIEDLPPEMLRADRFDKIMFAGFPTEEERKDIFKLHLGEDSENFNIDDLAEATSFFTGAEIKALIKEVSFNVGVEELRRPTTEEILEHVPNVRGRVWINKRKDIVAMYKRAIVEWDWASSHQRAEAEMVLNAASGKASKDKSVPAMAFGN